MLIGIQLAILAIFASPAFPQGLGVHYADPGPKPPTVPSVWMYWGECNLYAEMFLTCVDDNGKEAYTPGGDDGWRLDSGCHLNLIDYDGIWIEKDPRPRGRTGCAYAYEDERCCGKFQPIELTFSRKYLIDQESAERHLMLYRSWRNQGRFCGCGSALCRESL
jgi:hypothetical protein